MSTIIKNPTTQTGLKFDIRGLLIPALLIAAWQYASTLGASQAYAFVPLQQVWHALLHLLENGELWLNTLGSLQRTLSGLLIGSVSGLLLGTLLALSKTLNAIVSPLFHSLRQVPLLGLTPLIGLWLGNGESAKVFIISLAAFYPLVINTFEGLKNNEAKYQELGFLYHFSLWKSFWKIRLPQAMPHILTGMMLAVPFAWITTIGSELLFNAGAGLGNLMMQAEVGAQMDIILICAVVVTLSGIVMTYAVRKLSSYLLKWRPSNQL